MSEQKIKPFYIDAERHGLSETEANELLNSCTGYGATILERHTDYEEGLDKYPCFGIYGTDHYSFVQNRSWCEAVTEHNFTEISPIDINTWLKYGRTLEEHNTALSNARERILEHNIDPDETAAKLIEKHKINKIPYESTQKITTKEDLADFKDTKPTLGLLPRKQWIINRQYDIVRALARQADNSELLNEDWVNELVGLLELIGGE